MRQNPVNSDDDTEYLLSLGTLSLETESHCDLGDSDRSKPQSFALLESVPTELTLEIVRLSGGQWQSAYRALLLTCKRINALVRMECPPLLPVAIKTKKQGSSFLDTIQTNPEFITQISHLWLIGDIADDQAYHIVCLCTSLVSLACRPQVLEIFEDRYPQVSFLHRKIKHLTVIVAFPHTHLFLPLYDQLETFHLIGAGGGGHIFPNHIPKLKNLTRASFSAAESQFQLLNFSFFLQSPKLTRIAFLARPSAMTNLDVSLGSDFFVNMLKGKSCSVVRRQKRWTEMKVWRDCVWETVKEEGNAPG